MEDGKRLMGEWNSRPADSGASRDCSASSSHTHLCSYVFDRDERRVAHWHSIAINIVPDQFQIDARSVAKTTAQARSAPKREHNRD